MLDCLIKYNKKKINIENYSLDKIWNDQNLMSKDYDNLNSFFWLFSLDLKSSKKDTQNIILEWIEKNSRYNSKIEVMIVSQKFYNKISKLTYEERKSVYKSKFMYHYKKTN